MFRILLMIMLIVLSGNAYSATEISTAGTNIAIGTTSVANALSVQSTVAIGSATYTSTAAPSNGMIVEGNVGIGSFSPTQKLDVTGIVNATTLQTTASNTPQLGFYPIQNNDSHYTIGVNADGSNDDNDNLIFSKGLNLSSPKIVLSSVGNVGIGTNSPGVLLDISGDARLSGANTLYFASDGRSKILSTATTASNIEIWSGATRRMIFQDAGNIGIGTINPASPFEVRVQSRIGGVNSISFGDDSSNPLQIKASAVTSGDLQFLKSGSTRMIVSTNVGIGTSLTTPNKLSVGGNVGIGLAYSGLTAPLNGMIVQGNIGIGSFAPQGQFVLGNAAAQAGQVTCWAIGGQAGYCTSIVGAGGGCTCVGL